MKDNADKILQDTPNTIFYKKLQPQFIWENISDRTFTESLRLPDIQMKFQNFLNNNYPTNNAGVNDYVNEFQDILLDARNKSLKIKKVRKRYKIKNITNKKWFDKECRIKRHAVRKLANQKHRDPININLRNRYHHELKIYKNTLKLKKEEFHKQKIIELEKTAEMIQTLFGKYLKLWMMKCQTMQLQIQSLKNNGYLTSKHYTQNIVLMSHNTMS
jgi:hypothetical protein